MSEMTMPYGVMDNTKWEIKEYIDWCTEIITLNRAIF